MAAPLHDLESHGDTGDEKTPRWVKVFGIVTVLLLLFVVWHIVGGGHGPGQHGMAADSALPSAMPTEHQRHQP